MQRINPKKKSKAIIITFIAVLGILIAGYYLFYNEKTSIIKGDVKGNVFSSLFGSSKQKKVEIIPENPEQEQTNSEEQNLPENNEQNTTDQDPGNVNYNQGSGVPYTPGINPFPVPKNSSGSKTKTGTGGGTPIGKYQCNDGKDNDGDGKIDSKDPGCYKNFVINSLLYNETIDDESGDNKPTYSCPDDELEFTEAEKKELANLTKEFYKISATLKTPGDINVEYAVRKSFIDLVDQAEELTLQCVDEVNSFSYEGIKTRKENPYMDLTKLPAEASYLKTITPNSSYVTNDIQSSYSEQSPLQALYGLVKYINELDEKEITPQDKIVLLSSINGILGSDYTIQNPAVYYTKDMADKYSRDYDAVFLIQLKRYLYGKMPMVGNTKGQEKNSASNHLNICEGYYDYSILGDFSFALQELVYSGNKILKNINNYYIQGYGDGYGLSILKNLQKVPGFENYTAGDFGVNTTRGIELNKIFYDQIYRPLNYGAYEIGKSGAIQGLSDWFAKNPQDVDFNMNQKEQRACNDINGLKLLLNKTNDISKIKTYLKNTACNGSTSYYCYQQNTAVASINPNGYQWIATVNRQNQEFNSNGVFQELERIFNIW